MVPYTTHEEGFWRDCVISKTYQVYIKYAVVHNKQTHDKQELLVGAIMSLLQL